MVSAGNAARAQPRANGSAYRRREPEGTLLHATVRSHFKTFLAQVEERGDGAGLPRFVVSEFERYLACGILANGFARVRCTPCGDEMLVAFSCKGRGFCPSCTTRRMQADRDAPVGLRAAPRPRAPVGPLPAPSRLQGNETVAKLGSAAFVEGMTLEVAPPPGESQSA